MKEENIEEIERKLKHLWEFLSPTERKEYLTILYEKHKSLRKVGIRIQKSKSTVHRHLGNICRRKTKKHNPKRIPLIIPYVDYNRLKRILERKGIDVDEYLTEETRKLKKNIKKIIDEELRI